jgi:hypothetical protein
MKVYLNPPYFKPLLILAGLVMCANCAADEGDASTTAQLNVENAAHPSTKIVTDGPNVPGANTFVKIPNSMLVAPTYKFKNVVGTPGYYAEAFAYHCRAAIAGNANAQYVLGWLYANGRGVSKDDSMAALLFAKAAEQGHPLAQEMLADFPASSSRPDLPTCPVPDPPTSVVSTPTSQMAQAGQQAETAEVFYSKGPIFRLVDKLAPRYQIDTNLAMAFIAVESGFDVQATSPKNAQGLMQLIPETAKRFRVKNAYNAEDNIKGGLAYLQWLLAFFKGNVQLVAAAYNSGEQTVEKYKGIPPYPETQNYVQKIVMLYKKPSHPFRDDLVKASTILTP